MDSKKAERISKALGDPYRLKVMEMVKKQNDWMACSSILECLELSQSTVSHHINLLVDADLIIAEKDGRSMLYKINKKVMAEYITFLNVFSL